MYKDLKRYSYQDLLVINDIFTHGGRYRILPQDNKKDEKKEKKEKENK